MLKIELSTMNNNNKENRESVKEVGFSIANAIRGSGPQYRKRNQKSTI